jgi:chemotaxis signal transduction protein
MEKRRRQSAAPEGEREAAAYSVVSFHLDQKTYALPLTLVAQIIPMVKLTPLPQAHPAMAGVMNFRGDAVPVIDLRRYLGLPARAYELHTPILLSYTGGGDRRQRRDGRVVGLIVDEVHDVVDVDHRQIARVRDILPEGLGELPSVQGLVHTSEGAMMLLDLDHLFSMGPLKSLPEGWNDGDGFEPDDVPADAPQVPVTDKVAG